MSAPASAPNPFVAMTRSAFVPTLLVGPVAIVVAAVIGGGRAALGSALGYAVTIAFFTLGMIVMLRFAANTAPLLFMATALAVFFGQLIFLLVVILLLRNAEWLDGTAFGLTALAVALVWQVFQIIGYLRTRRLVYDETTPQGEVAGEASTPHTS